MEQDTGKAANEKPTARRREQRLLTKAEQDALIERTIEQHRGVYEELAKR